MQYQFGIVDKLSTLNELGRYQIERIAWLRLASVEQQVRRVAFQITPALNPEFECQYRAEWSVELTSGRVVKTGLSGVSVGAAVVRSAQNMGQEVSRRVALENNWAYRIWTTAREALSRLSLERATTPVTNCRRTMA